MSDLGKSVTEPTEAEYRAIVQASDWNGENLDRKVEQYGERVAREAYALGRLRGRMETLELVEALAVRGDRLRRKQ